MLEGFLFIMREMLTIPMFTYGSLLGIFTIFSLSHSDSNEEELKEAEMALSLMMDDSLAAKRRLVVNISWFTFAIYAIFSLVSMYIFLYDVYGSILSLFLLLIEISEQIIRLRKIKRADTLREMLNIERFSKITTIIHLIGIAAILGFLI